eukprot:TRINITY_DN66309_c0_g1_i1.p1 TRINITY_DN66309_c0_g1~~TRINITY_DN66309_c0_g1_i1.p1  ORF type:complete len:671 (-),score=91.53 TRINITY_DN66309_c0_g1_i1:20-1852(-)
MGNVEHGSWICWVHVAFTWYVVFVVQRSINLAQGQFVELRTLWLVRMRPPRSTTLLIENIPDAFCTDKALHDALNFFYPNLIESCFVVKKTTLLCNLLVEIDNLLKLTGRNAGEEERLKSLCQEVEKERLRILDAVNRANEQDESFVQNLFGLSAICFNRPSAASREDGADAVNQGTLGELQDWEALHAEASTSEKLRDASLFANTGFVTFASARAADAALVQGHLTSDDSQFVLSSLPAPEDVISASLQHEPFVADINRILGYCCIALTFTFYTPLVVTVASFSTSSGLEGLRQWSPSFDKLLASKPRLEVALKGYIGSLVLSVILSWIPMVFLRIFDAFFALRARSVAQSYMQSWYFVFLVVFVLLVTAVGGSVGLILATAKEIVVSPTVVVHLLARCLTQTTHFYLNFVALQWVDHMKNLVRIPVLAKYLAWKGVQDEEYAKQAAEPEDQDYNGLGSRGARFSFIMVTALTLCTISPLIGLLALVYFLLCRAVYGYLVVFAETRKPDRGGESWVTSLQSVSWGLWLFIFTMTGVLYERANTPWPSICAFASSLVWLLGHRRFGQMRWSHLSVASTSLKEKFSNASKVEQNETGKTYQQIELLPQASS